MTIIQAQNLSVSAGNKTIISIDQLSIKEGAVTALVGPNGAGKTTLLRAILGLASLNTGSVLIRGKNLNELSYGDRAKAMAYLPQMPEIYWPLKVFNLVAIGRLPHMGAFSDLGDEDKEAIETALKKVNALDLRERDVRSLSGGEKARVLMARMLATGSPILILDEPIAALDPHHQLNFLSLYRELAHEGKTILLVIHDLSLAARFSDEICLMNDGKVEGLGKPEDIMSDENIARVYKVKIHRLLGENKGIFIPAETVS